MSSFKGRLYHFLPGSIKVSVLVPLTDFKVTSPQILTLSSSSDYTFHIAADGWLIHAGALSQGKTARHSQALMNLTHLFCSGTELSVQKCVLGTQVKTSSKPSYVGYYMGK